MLSLKDSRNFSRTFTGTSLVVGPLLFLVGDAVDPAWADDSGAYLEEVAAAPDRYAAAGLLRLLGALFLVAGLMGVLHLLRGRRVTVGQVGAAMVLAGVVMANFYAISIVETTAAQPQFDRGQMVTMLDEAQNSPWAAVLFVAFLGGLMLGSVVLAVGIWLRRAAPVWVSVLLVAAWVIAFVGSGQLTSALTNLLLLGGLGGLAWRILSLSDEQWSQWQVLPDRPRRAEAPAAQPTGPAVA